MEQHLNFGTNIIQKNVLGTKIGYFCPVYAVESLLSSSKKWSKEANDIKLWLNKEKLSEELAVTVRSIHRVLYTLKMKDIIEVKANYIRIKDLNKLAQEAEDSRCE